MSAACSQKMLAARLWRCSPVRCADANATNLPARPLFKSFVAHPQREAIEFSRFLVATSAGEVGVNLDADHLVCDLTTLNSMIQRLGRVNRLGRDDADFVARVDVCVAPAKDDDLGVRLDKTRSILESLPRSRR